MKTPESKVEWGPRPENTPTREAFLRMRHPVGDGHTLAPPPCPADFEKWRGETLPPEIDAKSAPSPSANPSLIEFLHEDDAERVDLGGYDPADVDVDDAPRGRELAKAAPRISGTDGTYTTDLRERTNLGRANDAGIEPAIQRVRDDIESARTTAQDLDLFLGQFETATGTPPEVRVDEIALQMKWGRPPWDDRLRDLMKCASGFLAHRDKAVSFHRFGDCVRAVPLANSISGSAGRPDTTAALAKFASRYRRKKKMLRWKEIAGKWNALHPSETVSSENVRAAWRRHDKAKKRTKSG